MPAPEIVTPIPTQVVNELAAYGPFNLNDYIADSEHNPLRFSAQLKDGKALPKGMICTGDGMLTGIPAKGTFGNYELVITAENAEGSVEAPLVLTIKPTAQADEGKYFDQLKSQIWDALEHNLPAPDFSEMIARDVTPEEIYYLLERWAIIIVWDAFNLEPPGDKKLITIEGVSPHYNVYDRGSCLVAAPKDLYDHNRTILDGMQTARAVAREVFRRNWTIEMAGFDKLTAATWVELQHLGDEFGRRPEIINYTPKPSLIALYTEQAVQMAPRGAPE